MPTNTLKAKQRISDFLKHINSHQEQIRDLGNEAWQKTKGSEVEIIRQFLSKRDCGTALLNSKLTPILNKTGWVVKFASVFLHQTPMVRGWKKGDKKTRKTLSKKACELGDLQTLFLYVNSIKTLCKLRSVVFQAKTQPAQGEYVIATESQRQLYDECVGFRYVRPLEGKDRRLPIDLARERALQYLFVSERPVRARTIPATVDGGAFVEFGEHLLRFLNDSTGLDVNITPSENGDWDQIVWDVIESVAYKVTSKSMSRNQGLKALLDHFNSFEDHSRFYVGPDAPADDGFGVQLVIVWDSELGDDKAVVSEIGPLDRLVHLAKGYTRIASGDVESRQLELKRLVEAMAVVIHDGRVPHAEVVALAKKEQSDALIAGLAESIFKHRFDGDDQLLVELLSISSSPYTQYLVLRTLERFIEEQTVDPRRFEVFLREIEKLRGVESFGISKLMRDLDVAIQSQLHELFDEPSQTIQIQQQ